MQEELVDLFDDEDRMTLSSVTMTYAYAQKEGFLRGANLLVRNGDGKFWIPRRQSHKKTFPGSLDFSAWGHVSSGESYAEAIVREAKEEIGLDLDVEKLQSVHKMKYVPDGGEFDIRFHAQTFFYDYGGPIEFNSEDISEASWLEPGEILRKLSDPNEPKMKPWFEIVIQFITG